MTAGRAHGRVGLLGNPSDGYGGRVLAVSLPTMAADVQATPAARWTFVGAAGASISVSSLADLDGKFGRLSGGTELLAATVVAVAARRPELTTRPLELSFVTTIPAQVGLAGSSAIIIAALRALAADHEVGWDPIELARTALLVETDLLGWAAGPQDRVVQAYEGLIDMDFAVPWHAASYHRLDPALLPPLFVAWDQDAGERSDVAHSDVRGRWHGGDVEVRAVMRRFAALAATGRAALDDGRAAETWPALLDEAFELRSRIFAIRPADAALVETGRSLGAGVAFAGSGGAVVGAVDDRVVLDVLRDGYARHGAGFCIISPNGGSADAAKTARRCS